MKRIILVTALAAAVFVNVPLANAEDVFDPPWELGEFPTETYQAWEFTTDDLVVFADIDENPYGEPFIELLDAWDSWGEDPGLDGTYTAWHVGPPSGKHSIQIHNDPNEGVRKEVFVQITSSKAPISVSAPAHADATVTSPYPHHAHGVDTWYTYDFLVTIPGNPAMDYIEIVFEECTWVEEIIIHTRCVPIPEPGLLAIAGCGGLLFFRKKRK